MSEALTTDRADGVAWLAVNRPEVRNALDSALCAELASAFGALGEDPAVRAIVLRGAGERAFISGADVGEFRRRLATPEDALAYDAEAEALMAAIGSVAKPVIAMMHGFAIGSGLLVAMACDLRFASDALRVGIPVARLGLAPPVPDVARLVGLVGAGRAKYLLMTGRLLGAREALDWGLVNRVVPAEELEVVTAETARLLARNAPLSVKAVKQIVDRFGVRGDAVTQGRPWYEEIYTSEDVREGIDAFLERRTPSFRGA